MCGIVGILDFGQTGPRRQLRARMAAQIRHPGRDASGIYVDGSAGLPLAASIEPAYPEAPLSEAL